MVPTGTVLRDPELVGETISWSNRALCNAIDAVCLRVLVLTSTVEVGRGSIVSHTVVDSDFQPVSPAGFYSGARIFSVVGLAPTRAGNPVGIDGMI